MARKKHKVPKESEFKPDEPKESTEEAKEAKSETKNTKQEKLDPSTEETHTRISVIIYTIAAIAVGYASILISQILGNMLTIFTGLIFIWIVGKLIQITLGKKDLKWLIGNGAFIYIFVWLISWIFFFNLLGG